MRHSMAWPWNLTSSWRHGKSAAGGDADLLVHEVEAGDRLGDGMFDLQARVHFDEIELAILIEKFDGAGARIAEFGNGACADIADPRAFGRR